MDGHDRRDSRRDEARTEPRRSRFDRRSRSPHTRQSEAPRDRSPLAKDASGSGSESKRPDPTAAAAAAAARINAELQARKAPQNADSPPARSNKPPSGGGRPSTAAPKINGEIYVSDGDFIKDIEVNDLRNRYLVTRGSAQKMIKEETGADVTTRGSYYPDKSMATSDNPPLYLHITSTSKEGLEKAIAKIEEMMQQELPQLVDERRFRRREPPPDPVERDEFGRRKWPEEKIPIALDPIPGFNLRAQVVGHGGAYVKHIQQETGCRVQIKGRGSGYVEMSTGRESDEDMFLHVTGPDPKMVAHGKELCEDLLTNVKEQYEEFKSRPPRPHYGGGGDRGGYGDRQHHHHGSYQGYRNGAGNQGGYQGHHGHNNNNHANPSGHSHGPSASPQPPAANQPGANDYAAQYAQYYGGADPYAAYGGYAAYCQMYQQYYAAAQAGQQGGAPGAPGSSAAPAAPPGAPPGAASASPAPPGASASPPPPPPTESAPPPPPPPPSAPPPSPPPGAPGNNGYSAVPPPPGL